jgi:hypothetical protein
LGHGKKRRMDKSFKDLIRKHLERDAAWAEVRDWRTSNTNDRAGVLVIAAILDQALQSAIMTHCVTPDPEILFDFQNDNGAVLSTTAAKINLAYHLGIIPEWMKRDLKSINDIRNVFAHSPQPLSFDRSEIRAKCSELSSSKVTHYWGEFFDYLLGQMPYHIWENNHGRAWGHQQHLMGEVGSDEFNENLRKHNDMVRVGPPHSDNDRNRFWVICIIIFSYLKYEFAAAGPLMFGTSEFYKGVISAAEPPP